MVKKNQELEKVEDLAVVRWVIRYVVYRFRRDRDSGFDEEAVVFEQDCVFDDRGAQC